MTRPLIAVTTSARSGWRIYPLMAFNVWLGGGRSVRWGAGRPSDLNSVDGLIIGGGDDIQPTLYGGEIIAEARLDPGRDALERRLVLEALDREIPVLGICRGAQMLNVALGGSLFSRAYETFVASPYMKTILPRKRVEATSGTHLSRITERAVLKVNALHTQAVDRLGEGLRVAARDEGGMIQAVERKNAPFALGVQWHPEHLFYRTPHRRLFRALVGAAVARQAARSATHTAPDQIRSAHGALASS